MANAGYINLRNTYGLLEFKWRITNQYFDTLESDISWEVYFTPELKDTGEAAYTNREDLHSLLVKIGGTNVWCEEYNDGQGVIIFGKHCTIDPMREEAQLLASGTLKLAHNEKGFLGTDVDIEAYFYYADAQGWDDYCDTRDIELDAIRPPSTLFIAPNADNLPLGQEVTFYITKYISTFTHSISYSCKRTVGGTTTEKSGVICEKTTAESVTFTPPLDLMNLNSSGKTVLVEYTITTYDGDAVIGYNTYRRNYTIPSSTAPTITTVTLEDTSGVKDEFGCYVKNHSKIRVNIAGTKNETASNVVASVKVGDKTYSVSCTNSSDGKSYTGSIGEILLTEAGDFEISIGATDSRGYSATYTIPSITVHDYEAPRISSLTANRCTSLNDGTDKIDGGYVQVKFSAEVTDVNSRNSVTYIVEYKKVSAAAYTAVEVSKYANVLSIENGFFRFAADTASSYDIRLTVRDALGETQSLTNTSTAGAFWHWGADGNSMGIGKLAELPNGLDIGYVTRHAGGFVYPTLTAGVDLNSIKTPNTYIGENVSTAGFLNLPADLDTSEFSLEVFGIASKNIVKQRITELKKEDGQTFERMCYKGTWGEWLNISNFGGKILWCMTGLGGGIVGHPLFNDDELELFEPITKQKTGIFLVFEGIREGSPAYEGGSPLPERTNSNYSYHFIPKIHTSILNGKDVEFTFHDATGETPIFKRVYIYNDYIKGCAENYYDYPDRMLIYVIGV